MKMSKFVKVCMMAAVIGIVFGVHASSSYGQTGSCVSNTVSCNESTGYQIGGNYVLEAPPGSAGGNIAVGALALSSNSTGNNNTAVGVIALNGNTTGGGNTAIGNTALFVNTTGSNNTATGFFALAANTASNNSAFGYGALSNNTTGGFNTAMGYEALTDNSTGNSNTATGYKALLNNNANNNTAYGSGALADNTTGANNIAIGRNAGLNVSGGKSNNIEIGNGGSSSDSGVIRIGTTSQTSSYIAGIYGVSLPTTGQPLVCVDSSGQLGTVNCAANDEIEMLQRQNEDLRQRMARLEAFIEKK
jgi:hypothetical protein